MTRHDEKKITMKTFEYRLRPNHSQASLLAAAIQGTRELYNEALGEVISHHKTTGQHLGLHRQDKLHNKSRHPNLPAVLVDTTLKKLHRAFSFFFDGLRDGKKRGFPRFKNEKHWRTIQFRDAVTNGIDGSYFKAGKYLGGRIRFNRHRPLDGKLKFVRIVKRPSGWYIQCVCETDKQCLPLLDNAVGLDLGIAYLVADSDGGLVPNPRCLDVSAEKLAKAQQRASRCKPGSARRRKASRICARVHEKVRNQRRDFLHKVSRRYVNSYQTIVVEDLQIANMKRNHSLARQIHDASWWKLRSMLADKAENAGRTLIVVPAQYTSQRCSQCGGMVKKAISVRTHRCPHCGYIANRDTNAAKNILQARTGPSQRFGEGPSCTVSHPDR